MRLGPPGLKSGGLMLSAALAFVGCSTSAQRSAGPSSVTNTGVSTGSGGAALGSGDSSASGGAGLVSSGATSAGGGGAVGPCLNPTLVSPGAAPLRRLNHTEYDNTVEAILGITTKPARAFPLEERAHQFDNNATVRSVSQVLAEQYESAATLLAGTAGQDLPALLGCDPATAGEDACADQFLNSFGLKSFRRPLPPAEKARYWAFYQGAKASYGFAQAVPMLVAAILQTPQFLYRMELQETAGPALPAAPGVVEVGPYERATRLSYTLTQSSPDAELLGAAARGELATKEQVAAQARRLVQNPKARSNVVSFHSQWLDFMAMGQLTKDATLFPDFTPEVAQLMREEANTFVERTVFDGAGTLSALLQSPDSFMNDALAAFYGLSAPGSTTALVAVSQPPTQRSGLLTLAGLLAGHSTPTQGNPVTRGFFVRDSILCQTPSPPPTNLNIMVPAFDPALTTRERFAAHTSNAACAQCHQKLDPIGLGMEHYDAVGRWRTEEAGKPIDATGMLTDTDVDGPFVGAVELGAKLGTSRVVSDCAATRWFHFAYGRVEAQEDACAMEQLRATFANSKGDIRDLLVALTQTDTFLYRKVP
ncbi:MAG: DUF1592 domain-containing protein [Polyangiaceae bacterium]|nr:DUF1592 domain-containing protein [Polyangiaceae bacterium]